MGDESSCAQFYFNGHNAIQLQLDRQGIQYRLKDNAFVDVDDPEALRKAAQSLNGRAVLNRISYWMDMFFRFEKGKYSTRFKFLEHNWYLVPERKLSFSPISASDKNFNPRNIQYIPAVKILIFLDLDEKSWFSFRHYLSQIEISSNIVFRSARFCTHLFERLLDKFQRLGPACSAFAAGNAGRLPETIAQIFSRRLHRRSTSKTFWRLYDNNACIKHWFRGNSIKQYNKTGYFIRTETTINNPKSLGLQKPVLFLQAYLWEGVACNNRFLECCADVDIASISEGDEERFTKPVQDHLGRNVTPPDFRKDRQIALAKELLKPKYHAYGFRTVDLLKNLPQFFRNPAQIRYEMNKLRVRGIVEKKKGMSFYRVTGTGWKWLWVSICSERHFKNPMISTGSKKTPSFSADQPSKIEAAYSMLNQGLSVLTQELALIS